jgi:protein farnesyltransferase/geranylgeranyltransferase type-1 subunit alpha
LNHFLVAAEDDGGSDGDAKNYHAWAHRQWLVRTFNLWSLELGVVELLLAADIRNNSAWNHRFFVVTKGGSEDVPLSVRQEEVKWALSKVALAPHNESAWSYLRGMMGEGGAHGGGGGDGGGGVGGGGGIWRYRAGEFDGLRSEVEALSQSSQPSPFCLELMADLHLEASAAVGGDEEAKSKAAAIFDRLATDIDVIRKPYWMQRKQEVLAVQ